jgi:lipopolysaccharide transport system permease protein
MNTAEQTIRPGSLEVDIGSTISDRDDLRQRAWLDITYGLKNWRMWWLLGMGDIRQRYRRSRLGQFWITLSITIFIVAIGVVYATLFKQPISTYLPYLATTFIVWSLIAGIINDSTTAFVQAENFLRQQAMPKSTFILRIIVRNFLTFGHNVIILPFVFVIFGISVSWVTLAGLFGLVLIAVAGLLAGAVCAILCTRFRDLPQIVQNIMQVTFFVSPVTWQPELIGENARLFVLLNPFAAFLRIVSEPLLGRVPPAATYLSAGITIVILAAVAWALFTRFRQRIVYWL